MTAGAELPIGDRVHLGVRHRWSIAALLSLALLLAGGVVHAFFAQGGRGASIHARGVDDAYISYRYAHHLVEGEGLVYNPGERVEGFSNLLHVLLAAGLLLVVERDQLYTAVSGVNMLLLAAVWLVFRRHTPRSLGAMPLVLLSLSPPLWGWAASGLESIGVLALQIWIWNLVDRWDRDGSAPRSLPVAFGLAVLVRADGFVLVAIVVAYWLARREAGRGLRALFAASPSLLLLFGGRLLYYGRWMPNTYHAKVAGPLDDRLATAVELLWSFALTTGIGLYLLVVPLAGLVQVATGRLRRGSFGPFLGTSLIVYWLVIGGDHLGMRFLLVVIPIGILIVLEASRRLPSPARFGVFGLALALQVLPAMHTPRFLYGSERYDGWITLGRFLGEHHAGASLATGAAGKIPFFSGLPTLDMWGLTDAHIAVREIDRFTRPGHNKSDPDYVLARRPELIAAWIRPDLDAAPGLARSRYRAAGYGVAYLVNASSHSRTSNVIDVRGRSEAEINRLILEGNNLGVLELAAAAESYRLVPLPGRRTASDPLSSPSRPAGTGYRGR